MCLLNNNISFAKQFLDASFIESMFNVVGTLENCLNIKKIVIKSQRIIIFQ